MQLLSVGFLDTGYISKGSLNVLEDVRGSVSPDTGFREQSGFGPERSRVKISTSYAC